MKTYAAIFDMDGVIADTNPFHVDSFRIFFDRYALKYDEADFKDHMYGKHNSYIMRHFFGKELNSEEIHALENEKEGLFREIYRAEATPVPGLVDFLTQLKSEGFALAVATSAPPANMDMVLDALDIRSYFDSTMSGDDVSRHKPDPQVYLQSAERLQAAPQDCIVFEDSHSGATAGLRAGMRVVGLLTTHQQDELPPCSRYIRDFREITADDVLAILAQ